MFTCNEMGPVNPEEMGFSVFLILLSGLLNSQIFGEIALLLYEMQKKQTLYQMKLDDANNILSNINLPFHSQCDMREFI